MGFTLYVDAVLLTYLLRRLLLAVPVWVLITLLALVLSRQVLPSAEQLLAEEAELSRVRDLPADQFLLDDYLIEINQQYGFDQPLFYFSLQPLALPDSFGRYRYTLARPWLEAWLARYGRWTEVHGFRRALRGWMEALDQSPAPARVRDSLATATRSFYFYGRPEQFAAYAATTQRRLDQHPALLSGRARARWRAVEQRHQAMGERAPPGATTAQPCAGTARPTNTTSGWWASGPRTGVTPWSSAARPSARTCGPTCPAPSATPSPPW